MFHSYVILPEGQYKFLVGPPSLPKNAQNQNAGGLRERMEMNGGLLTGIKPEDRGSTSKTESTFDSSTVELVVWP